MILKRLRLKKLILDMIVTHAPRVAAGAGLTVRREGKQDVLELSRENAARLETITVTLPAESSGGVNLGPATSDSGVTAGLGARPPRIPTLGPGRRLR